MIELRPATTRGHTRHDWLERWHSFSCADYRDPAHLHWGPLRALDDVCIAPGAGVSPHGYRDTEIISLVLAGTLEIRDSLGRSLRVRPGEVHRLSAGHGVVQGEINPSPEEPLHYLQISIIPDVVGLQPSSELTCFGDHDRHDRLCLLASSDGEAGSLHLNQDIRLFGSALAVGSCLQHVVAPHRLAYLHVLRGKLAVNGHPLGAGDALRIGEDIALRIVGGEAGGELLLFDLPAQRAGFQREGASKAS
ncbi:pirin family protein [Uliginosibacterium sp. H1]|uniref:pirin family protein n=1 Tax=Uliginosibacterium sp. H1 TaxID=3114757 RepID=UPI002E1838AF|nr:pirin family protein [Uliginosibacterium sp. H1]